MYDIAVFGSPSFDMITRNSVKGTERTLSGPAITTAITASKLGIDQMVVIGSISSEFERQFVNDFDRLGIPEYFTVNAPETGGFEIECEQDKESVITRVLGIPRPLGIREIPEEFLTAKIIALCPLMHEIDAELVEWICNSSDAQILLDPQLRSVDENRKLTVISELYIASKTRSFIDFIIPSEKEAYLITGEIDPFVAAEIIVDSIADHCIITLDSQGCLLFDGEKFSIIPSQSPKTCNILDAGAAFLGGFAYGLLNDYTPASCAALGTSVVTFMSPESRTDFSLNPTDVIQKANEIALDIVTR